MRATLAINELTIPSYPVYPYVAFYLVAAN